MVAVQASRLSTGLHQLGKPGEVQESSKFRGCVDTFFGSGMRDSASAPYTLTSVGIFSILFSIHYQGCWQGEVVKQWRLSLVGDHFLYSQDLNVWFGGDNVLGETVRQSLIRRKRVPYTYFMICDWAINFSSWIVVKDDKIRLCLHEWIFFYLNMTCDLRTELNVIPEPFRFAWGIGDRHVSVPLVSLSDYMDVRKRFFFLFVVWDLGIESFYWLLGELWIVYQIKIFTNFFPHPRSARSDHSCVAIHGYSWKSDIFVHDPCTTGGTYNSNANVHFWLSTGWSDTGIC